MTLQLRPTFSESWYRVANLKVKLRAGAQISRQFYRGERWYVVRDPAGNQFHRLSDPAYRFVGLLDGRRTVSEAWELAGGQLADDAPTQPEVIQILSHLYSANLIEADVTPDATVLLRRHKKMQQRRLQGRLMNVLFPRIPLWDPDRFLVRWMPLVRQMFSKFGALVWLAVVIGAIVRLVPLWPELKLAARHSVDLSANPANAFWLWGVFVFVKLIHELGHAFSCRRFGGECHELGIMFLVFVPTPYVDASTAWSFPNKWHRVFVGAAGMIVELFFAALCAFFWATTDKSTLASQLAFNAMLIASVSTVLFNANPLLRYDGYYILSDWLEIPNLRQKSTEYTTGLIKRHVFRVKAQQPLPPVGQRFWLFFYAVTSSVYRVFIGFMIMLLVAFQIPVLGILMAVGGLITWMIVPLVKTFKYLAIDPELHRKRGRATAFTLAVAAAVVVLIGVIPFWVDVTSSGIVDAMPDRKAVVYAGYDGFVERVNVRDGQHVKKDDVLIVLRNEELDAQIVQTEAQVREAEQQARNAFALSIGDYRGAQQAARYARDRLNHFLELKDRLTIKAPVDGEVVAPHIHEMVGGFLAGGSEVATVQAREKLLVRTIVEQRDIEPVVQTAINPDDPTGGRPNAQVRMAGAIADILPALTVEKLPAALQELPHASLGQAGGENVAVDPKDPKGKTAAAPQFQVGVTVDNSDGRFHPGQRAYVRFRLFKRPLIWQWGRRFWQLIQTESSGSKWL
jgi:putative peptide zinc metalloprotease protein